MIHFSRFSTGGFVLHKIIVGRSKYSAWYDVEGKLLDCEMILPNCTTRNVPARNVNVLAELATIGRRYADRKQVNR